MVREMYASVVSGHVQDKEEWLADYSAMTEDDRDNLTPEESFNTAVDREMLIFVQWDSIDQTWVDPKANYFLVSDVFWRCPVSDHIKSKAEWIAACGEERCRVALRMGDLSEVEWHSQEQTWI